MENQGTQKPRWRQTRRDAFVMIVEVVAFTGQIVVCFLFYNWLRLYLLLYLGWLLLAAAMIVAWRARLAFQTKGQVPEGGKWIQTRVVVDSGIYGVIRHPMYFSFMLISLGMMGISQHWLSLILGAALLLGLYDDMHREERNNLAKFGEDYLRYMREVPRMNFLSGVMRRIQRRAKT